MATPSGERNRRVRFERRALDENGDRTGDWEAKPVLETWAKVLYLRGGEAVISQRLVGVKPVVINVRACDELSAVGNGWRAVDVRSGEAFGLIAVTPQRREFDILGEGGPGDGEAIPDGST